MRNTRLVPLIACTWIACASAQAPAPHSGIPASVPTPAIPSTAATDPTGCCQIAADTIVDLEIIEPISSSRQHRGDYFAIRLVESVRADGNVIIPSGTTGVGQIVHAQAAHSGGAPGELILAARHLDFAGQQLPLHAMKLGGSGKDNTSIALGVSLAAGPFALFIRGHEIEIPAGTRAHAKIAQAVVLPPIPDPSVVPVQASTLATQSTLEN